jgi:hypothetical protein
MDIAVGNVVSNNITTMLGTGTGSFTNSVNRPTGLNPYSICSADFDADGRPDIATPNYNSSSSTVYWNCVLTGKQEVFLFDQISVYPNPNQGTFTIHSAESNKADISIYDVLGKKVYEENAVLYSNLLIDLSNHPNGIYFLNMRSGESLMTKKIVLHK